MLSRPNMPMVSNDQFSMVPRSEVPRSTFRTRHSLKTCFQSGNLIPIHVDEVLPGDVHRGQVTIFARLNTLLFPFMDNCTLETFFFFVPNRIVWSNWRKMMGEQVLPSDSIAFTTPQIVSPAGGFAVNSLYDYFGLPTVGQVTAGLTVSINALPLRAYHAIWNEWFRDETIDPSAFISTSDGPDAYTSYNMLQRRKKHDYFTSCLPWPVKGGVEVPLPLGSTAPVKTQSAYVMTGAQTAIAFQLASGAGNPADRVLQVVTAIGGAGATAAGANSPVYPANLYADLSSATGATLNAVRLAVTTQQFLERDARGGTRYTEILKSHFGVQSEDQRLQRPEYLGGGVTRIETSAIPQTSATGLTGGGTPLGGLSGQATAAGQHEFVCHATEHGFIIGLVHVTADITYQQGLHRMWTRLTRFDHYWPTFQNLGEQAVRNDEIYVTGGATDIQVFGYQERWAEYRHRQSRITGLFRSTSAGNIDEWHASQQFTALPTLNATFLKDTPPLSRVLAAGAAADNQQILFDSVFDIACTRAMPVYSVPGLARF